MEKKNMIIHLVSCCVLCLGFLLCRYVFLELHGMKAWSFDLFVFSFVILVISFFVKATLLPLFTSLSYIVGFVIGLLFQTDGLDFGGGKTSNLWLIWTVVIICAVISSILGELVKKKHNNK